MITVTRLAQEKVLEAQAQEGRPRDGLRVIVRNGGTPRVEYALHFVEAGAGLPGDRIVDAGGFQLHVDPGSAPFLEGAILDYVEGARESGFKIDAPRAGPPRPPVPLVEALQ